METIWQTKIAAFYETDLDPKSSAMNDSSRFKKITSDQILIFLNAKKDIIGKVE